MLLVMAACVAPRPRQPAPAPAEPVTTSPRPPITDLSGGWATGSEGEPPAGPVTLRPGCAHNPAVWIIQQQGNALQTWAFPQSFNQGIARADPVQRTPAIPGTISGDSVSIRDGDVRVVLRYDAQSGHLRGTRDGVPFWAARQVIVRDLCPGIP